jgi:hypothetical protein
MERPKPTIGPAPGKRFKNGQKFDTSCAWRHVLWRHAYPMHVSHKPHVYPVHVSQTTSTSYACLDKPHAYPMHASQTTCIPHACVSQTTCIPHACVSQTTCIPHACVSQTTCIPYASMHTCIHTGQHTLHTGIHIYIHTGYSSLLSSPFRSLQKHLGEFILIYNIRNKLIYLSIAHEVKSQSWTYPKLIL